MEHKQAIKNLQDMSEKHKKDILLLSSKLEGKKTELREAVEITRRMITRTETMWQTLRALARELGD